MNGYIVQRNYKMGGWLDYTGFAEIADAEVFIAAQDDPTEWQIIECEECDD
jgi:hypothetical protein